MDLSTLYPTVGALITVLDSLLEKSQLNKSVITTDLLFLCFLCFKLWNVSFRIVLLSETYSSIKKLSKHGILKEKWKHHKQAAQTMTTSAFL